MAHPERSAAQAGKRRRLCCTRHHLSWLRLPQGTTDGRLGWPTVLEAGSPSSRHQQGWLLVRPFLLACRWRLSAQLWRLFLCL